MFLNFMYLFSDFAFVVSVLSPYFPNQTTWYNLHKIGKANRTLALKYQNQAEERNQHKPV